MIISIILSGGIGTRMGQGTPKQYMLFNGRPILCYALQVFERHPQVDKLIIVADTVWRPSIDQWLAEDDIAKFADYADPGENRQLSIKNGLLALRSQASEDDIVIIHDAARPLVSTELISRCLEALPGHDGVMPYLPAKDTFYLLDEGGRVSEELPRRRLAAGQAPEAFRYGRYLQINEAMAYEEIIKISGSTEIALKFGLDIVAIPGEERNLKITTRDDLLLLDKYLEENRT